MQELYEIASHWETATDEQVTLFKRFVERIVGYSTKLKIWESHWLLRTMPSECVIQVVDVNDEEMKLKDVLILQEIAGFAISDGYNSYYDIEPPTKDRWKQMWSVIDAIHTELNIPLDPERFNEREDYEPDDPFS